MTRIIAGAARGRQLVVPSGAARPTSDRVRESMFASLDHLLGGFSDVRVLDLFAGSGALGLEAVSRGAVRAVLVERDRPSVDVARRNAAVLGLTGVVVVPTPVAGYLAGSPEPFDLVLADPPYATSAAAVEDFLGALTRGWLAPDAVVVVERPTRGGEFAWPTRTVGVRRKAYGTTTLWYGRAASDGRDT